MFGKRDHRVIIDVKQDETVHNVEAFGVIGAISTAMDNQGIEECCRATVQHEDGDRDLFINVKKVATVGLKWGARGKE